MNRLNSGIYTNLVNQTMGEVADENAYLETGPKINLYEFDIVSGFIYISERGENSITTNPANNRTNVMVQTSNEPIVCYWKDSYYSTLNEDKLSSTKHFLIGKYYEATLTSVAMTLEQSKVEWNQNDFNSFSTNKSITLVIKDKTFENIDTTKKLYLILDERAKSLQWLKVTNVVSIYDQVSENLVQNIVTLENLNLAFSTNGKDIMTFVQLAHPGGNYAFPKEVYTAVENGPAIKTVQLDPTYLFRLHGATNVQLELNCGVAINSIFMYGRETNILTIKTPKRLLLSRADVPQPSALQVIGAPATNYYAIFNAKNIMESFWEDWKNKFESYYNYLSKKVNNGGFEFNAANARLTNTINASSGQYENSSFSIWTFNPQDGDDITYNCKENAYTEKNIKFLKTGNYSVCDFLNMNAFIFQTQMNLPISYKETTRWELKDIPIIGSAIGGFLKLFLGFSPGWNQTNEWVSGKPINFILPCTTFEMGNTIMGGTGNKFPYDVLTNDNNQFTATGNRYQVSTINATITDRFITTNPNYIIAGAIADMGGGGIWDTKYLTQDKDENGNSLNIVKTQSNPDGKLLWHTECKSYKKNDEQKEFEIDFIDYKVVGKCDTRLTFYTNNTLDGSLETLYETRHQTVAKFKDDGTLWDNYFILNFMTRENSDNYFVWPENPNLPLPPYANLEVKSLREKTIINEYSFVQNNKYYLIKKDDYPPSDYFLLPPNKEKTKFPFINLFSENTSSSTGEYVTVNVTSLAETGYSLETLLSHYKEIRISFKVSSCLSGEWINEDLVYAFNLEECVSENGCELELIDNTNSKQFMLNERWFVNVEQWKDRELNNTNRQLVFKANNHNIASNIVFNQPNISRKEIKISETKVSTFDAYSEYLGIGEVYGKIKVKINNAEEMNISIKCLARTIPIEEHYTQTTKNNYDVFLSKPYYEINMTSPRGNQIYSPKLKITNCIIVSKQ